MSNCTCSSNSTPGVLGVTTTGIQDVSALLPLLGTEQCELHTLSGLDRGFLYSAAAGLSIFGSLGITKAGFKVLVGCIDRPQFSGPRFLQNAGFGSGGVAKLLTFARKPDWADDPKHYLYVLEDKLRSTLSRKTITKVAICWTSRHFILWNLNMAICTIGLNSLGLLSFVYLLVHDLPKASFEASWLYPLLRITGTAVTSICAQIILELRIIEEAYCRITFTAIDGIFKSRYCAIPGYWDPDIRSKSVLKYLAVDYQKERRPFDSESQSAQGQGNVGNKDLFSNMGRITSFACNHTTDTHQSEADLAVTKSSFRIWLVIAFLSLAAGVCCSVVGYVGCFSLIQASATFWGPVSWLLCEIGLCLLRTIIWARNPSWDDPKSLIAIEKIVSASDQRPHQKTNSFSIGWCLDAVTTNDMHALIVGISDYDDKAFLRLPGAEKDAHSIHDYLRDELLVPNNQIRVLTNEKATKSNILQELDSLAFSGDVRFDAPIVIFFALHSGKYDNTCYMVPYLGSGSRSASISTPEEKLSPDIEEWISYEEILNSLQQISERKTDNILLILDSCHAGAMGGGKNNFRVSTQSNEYDSQKEQVRSVPSQSEVMRGMLRTKLKAFEEPPEELLLGHPSHMLLAACGTTQSAADTLTGGLFTNTMLEILRTSNRSLATMTYKELVSQINGKMAKSTGRYHRQTAQCTTIFQNKLLFNGLFARQLHDDSFTPLIKVSYVDSSTSGLSSTAK